MALDWSWSTAVWKAVRSALLATLAVALTSGTVDVFFDHLSSGLNPIIPLWTIPIVAALLTVARNFLKQWAKSPN